MFRGFFILIKLLITLLLLPGAAFSGSYQHQFSAVGGVEYDTNPRLVIDDNKQSVWRGIFTPAYNFNYDEGADHFAFDGRIRFEKSSDDNLSVPRQDPQVMLTWIRSLPTDTYSIAGSYDRSSTLKTEFEDTGRITGDGTIGKAALIGRWKHLFSARTNLDLGANVLNATYFGVDLVDYTTTSADLALLHQLTGRFEPLVRVSATQYTPRPDYGESLESSRLFTYLIGSIYQFDEKIRLNAEIGTGNTQGPSSGSGLLGKASIEYEGSRNRFLLTGGRYPEPISRTLSTQDLGGFRVNDRVNGLWEFAINNRTSSTVDLAWLRNEEIGQQRISRVFSAYIKRQLSEFWSLNGYYRYRNQELIELNQNRATAHTIGVNLTWGEPDFKLTLPSNL